jgi:DNA gyrase subunit A
MLKSDLSDKKELFMATNKGTVKRTVVSEFDNIRRSGLIAQKLPPGDELKWVCATDGTNEVFLLSRKGKAIRFKETDVRSMGRAAAGVRGITLGAGDEVVMENGLGKMTPVEQYRSQGRGGSGVKAAQLTAKTGDIIGAHVLNEGEEGDLLCVSKQGQMVRMELKEIPSRGRATQGVIVMRLNGGDKVATMSVVLVDKEAEEAVMQAALEEQSGEVEALEAEKEQISEIEEKAARSAKRRSKKLEKEVGA